MRMASAFYESGVLFAASDVGVFRELAAHGRTDVDKLAGMLRVNRRGLRLLLDACVAVGLLEKCGDLYGNAAEASAFLVPGAAGDLSGALRYNRDVYAAWGRLTDLVRTGQPVEAPAVHLGGDAARTRAFVMAMHGRALAIGRGAVAKIDLKGCKRLLDIGGGPGTMAGLLARANPDLHCQVIELPAAAAIANELLQEQGLRERVTMIPGDYHATPFPPENDAVLFSGVLHQESPDAIRELFTRAYQCLVPGGRLYVLDMMTDETHTAPAFSALFAVNMALTTNNGWVFSDVELGGWLEESGFAAYGCAPLPPPLPHWLACARKPG